MPQNNVLYKNVDAEITLVSIYLLKCPQIIKSCIGDFSGILFTLQVGQGNAIIPLAVKPGSTIVNTDPRS